MSLSIRAHLIVCLAASAATADPSVKLLSPEKGWIAEAPELEVLLKGSFTALSEGWVNPSPTPGIKVDHCYIAQSTDTLFLAAVAQASVVLPRLGYAVERRGQKPVATREKIVAILPPADGKGPSQLMICAGDPLNAQKQMDRFLAQQPEVSPLAGFASELGLTAARMARTRFSNQPDSVELTFTIDATKMQHAASWFKQQRWEHPKSTVWSSRKLVGLYDDVEHKLMFMTRP